MWKTCYGGQWPIPMEALPFCFRIMYNITDLSFKVPSHCYLPDWTFKKWGLSSFGFQSFQRWIGTQKNKNFSIPVRYCWGPNYQGKAIPAHSKKTPKWHFLTPAWNLNLFGQSAKKVPFWDFIQNVSQALSKWINGIISKSPPRNLKKNLFV